MKYYKYLIIILFLFSSNSLLSQRRSNLVLNINGAYSLGDFHITFNDGINTFLLDSIVNGFAIVKKELFSPFGYIAISYQNKQSFNYFVDEYSSKINLEIYQSFNGKDTITANVQNATPIMDPSKSQMYKGLLEIRKNAGKEMTLFWQKNGVNYKKSDSLTLEYSRILKVLNQKTMDYLEKYPNEYFSFWFFKTQVVGPTFIFINNDHTYIDSLISYTKSTFPRYTKSQEGAYLMESLLGMKVNIKIGDQAPEINTFDKDGQPIELKNLRGQLVLLDFWASWCPPCLQQTPNIKHLQDEFSVNDLIILGINTDSDSKPFHKAIKDHGMTWQHVRDHDRKISNLFGITALPSMVLIDKKGHVIYYNKGIESGEKLKKLIKEQLLNNK